VIHFEDRRCSYSTGDICDHGNTLMKKRIVALILAVVFVAACAGTSHAFGILRVIFDGIANQFGLDRGTIPKVDLRLIPKLKSCRAPHHHPETPSRAEPTSRLTGSELHQPFRPGFLP
jgi:hypothetical protein